MRFSQTSAISGWIILLDGSGDLCLAGYGASFHLVDASSNSHKFYQTKRSPDNTNGGLSPVENY